MIGEAAGPDFIRPDFIRPDFMTCAMWFAWLLRRDARDGARLDDAEAQREFVLWWLLLGRDHFPGAWWYGPRQEAVVMESVAAGSTLALPRLLRALRRRSPQIARDFRLDDAEDAAEFCCWYRLSGSAALSIAPPLPPAVIALTEAASERPAWTASGTRVPRMAVAMWRANPGLQGSYDAQSAAGRNALASWYDASGRAIVPRGADPPAWPEPLPPPSVRVADRGVNIIGYPNEASGVGEDARALAAALTDVGIENISIDVRPGSPTAADVPEAALRHGVTVFCLNPFDTARLFLERGPALFAGRRNIGYWPWELPIFPAVWRGVIDLVDEVWAASEFTAAAMRASTGKPVRVLPPAVTTHQRAKLTRRQIGLPEQEFLFIYPFDPNSYLARKNPEAAAAAFRRAFPAADDNVRLILRANGDPAASPGWSRVWDAMAGDPRIVVEARSFDRPAALGYLACCDCLISPHRAEGLGRNLAEALALGVPVLATGFSGCVDFLAPAEAIRWTWREVAAEDYPFGEGAWWAEPDIAHMATRMRAIRRLGAARRASLGRRRAVQIQALFDPATAGRRYAEALGERAGVPVHGALTP